MTDTAPPELPFNEPNADATFPPSVEGDIDRRSFLRLLGGALGGFVLVSLAPSATNATVASSTAPPQFFCTIPLGPDLQIHNVQPQVITQVAQTLAKFVDPLPIPATIQPVGTRKGLPLFDVRIRQVTQQLHRDLPPTTVWGYNGVYPGPTFEVEQGHPIAVRWKNKLPLQHLFTRDTTIHGDEPDKPPVRTVTHVHGLHVLPESDGYPEAWFSRNFSQKGPYFVRKVYEYPNDQLATTLWYHDHALGITRLNIYAGLSGFYLIHSEAERSLDLPSGKLDIPLLIQDRMFNPDGSLFYPVANSNDPKVPPIWIPEFFGDTLLVNGKIWPFLEVEPRKYRFRLLNGSNSRFYNLSLNQTDATGKNIEAPGPSFHVIGSDGGLLPKPVEVSQVLISPAERFDVVVDFSDYADTSVLLSNDAPAPYPIGGAYVPTDVMLFRVKPRGTRRDDANLNDKLPKRLSPVLPLALESAVTVRDLIIFASFSSGGPIAWFINAHWDDPVTEDPHAGDTEVWRIFNRGAVVHPIHIHLVQFQVIDRRPYDRTQFPGKLVFTGPAQKPPPEEFPAWKDTVKAYPNEMTRVIAKFKLPRGTHATPGERFRYVYHCHMVEHEDNEMMRPYEVVA